MKALYKVKLTPNPIIVRVEDDQEEIIYDRYMKIKVAESLCSALNNGLEINFDDIH